MEFRDSQGNLVRTKSIPLFTTAQAEMPRINPHASVLKQDKQLIAQIKWLKQHGFKTAREAQESGY